MILDFERELAATPEQLWDLLTQPERMNEWSTAKISLVSPGDAGRADGVGALRRVDVPGFLGVKQRLREVVVVSEPGRRFGYSVYDSPPIRRHAGSMTLTPSGGGTRLRWLVNAELASPLLEKFAEKLLRRELRKSLDKMEKLAGSGLSATTAVAREVSAPVTRELLQHAEEIRAEQEARADELAAAGDPRVWFTRVYQYVTTEQIRASTMGEFEHPGWVLRLVPVFHRYYVENLDVDEPHFAEQQWRRAFRAMFDDKRDARARLFLGLLLAVRAHIEEDLPRAMAEVWAEHYRGVCDYVRFRGDYVRMAGVFRAASERLLDDDVPADYVPWWAGAARDAMPRELSDMLRHKQFYDIPRERMNAFERGERLSELLVRCGAS